MESQHLLTDPSNGVCAMEGQFSVSGHSQQDIESRVASTEDLQVVGVEVPKFSWLPSLVVTCKGALGKVEWELGVEILSSGFYGTVQTGCEQVVML